MTQTLTRTRAANLDEALDEIDTSAPAARIGAPEIKAGRPAAGQPDPVRAAVVAIGKEVLKIGDTVRAMRQATDLTKGRLQVLEKADNAKRVAVRSAQVKADRPPHLRSAVAAPAVHGTRAANPARSMHRKAIEHWMRTGAETYRGHALDDLAREAYGAWARKAMHTEDSTAGGYFAFPERRAGAPLDVAMAELNPFRGAVEVKPITGKQYEIPVNNRGTASGWVGEREARAETAAPDIGLRIITPMELYAAPAATQRLLDDADFDVDAWLTNEVAREFVEREGDAYINGNGITQPKGLLTYDLVSPASWTPTSHAFRYHATGVSGAFLPTAPHASPATMPDDVLIDVSQTLKAGYRTRASWLMNQTTVGVVRKMRDAEGRPLWQPSTQAGQPATLLGYPIVEDAAMPDIGADTYAIGFGDWESTYVIVERFGVRVLRDPYTNKPLVEFYTTKRVGGGVKSFDSAVFLKFGTS